MPLATPPVLRRLAGALPPALRRAAAGLWLDALGLPARLADPSRRDEPWQALHNVGGGDFRVAGEGLLALLQARAGLSPSSRVLDIGCGTGRLAAPLAAYLSREGAYTGFDVSRRAVAACRRRFARTRPDFRFLHADLKNGEYSPRGAAAETGYRFPAADGAVDVAAAVSVFTHMRLEAIEAYLREAARVLAPGGRFLFTAYALTPERRAGAGLCDFGPASQVLDPRAPERLIGHDTTAFEAAVARAGLRTLAADLGVWAQGATCSEGQDVYVVARG